MALKQLKVSTTLIMFKFNHHDLNINSLNPYFLSKLTLFLFLKDRRGIEVTGT